MEGAESIRCSGSSIYYCLFVFGLKILRDFKGLLYLVGTGTDRIVMGVMGASGGLSVA